MRFVLASIFSLTVLSQPFSAPPAAAAEEAVPAEAPAPAGAAEEARPAGNAPTAPADPEPVRLGTTEKALRARFGEALRPVRLEQKKHPGYAFMEEKMRARRLPGEGEGEEPDPVAIQDPYENQTRLVRKLPEGEVVEVEYDLHKGKVYAIRWKLAERFERTLIDGYVGKAQDRYGKPDYDQSVDARFGSGKVDLRRTGWSREDRLLEVRQLDPKSGGPVYVMLADKSVYRDIVAAKGAVAPSPDSMGPWWERPAKRYEPIGKGEREALLDDFGEILDRIGYPAAPPITSR